jgi:phage host-nuclease inhibitor protein Gam
MGFFDKLQDIVLKFVPKKEIVQELIEDKEEAMNVLAQLGEMQVKSIRFQADLVEKILKLQKNGGKELDRIEKESSRLLTKLREFGLANNLHTGQEGSQSLQLNTGTIAFYRGSVTLSVASEKEVVARLQTDPELARFLITPPPPAVKINKEALLQDPVALAKVNGLFEKPVLTKKRSLHFSAHPTSLSQIKEGIKIKGKVKDEKVD